MRRVLAALSCAVLLASPVFGQQVLQFGFESRGPYFKPGASDASFKVLDHSLTKQSAHGGERSEYLRLQVEKGRYIHYTFELPHAPVTDELNLSLWLKANRPGAQVLVRLVLPRERDPNNAAAPLSVLVPCEAYNSTRWKLIGLRQPMKRLREQQQLLTHKAGRGVVMAGAYIDQVVLNVCDGPGLTEVWVDDLEVGPVVGDRPIATPAVRPRVNGVDEAPRGATSEVQVSGNQLLVGGQKFFLRGIRHTGMPLQVLYEAGFNTLWLDESAEPATLEQASKLGLWVVPALQGPTASLARSAGGVEGHLTSGETLGRKMAKFLRHDGVLAWDVGRDLGHERFPEVARFARTVRAADPNRPTLVDVWDGFKGYSRALQGDVMVGTHRWPLFTSLDLAAYREWLAMRRRLSSDGYFWTWVQTHLPGWFVQHALEHDGKGELTTPVGPHPEQVRLLTYCALAAGYRGVAYWADGSLADSQQGRDRLLALALLNQELKMLEPILTRVTQPPEWINTSRGEVKAAVFRTPKCVLVLPVWVGGGSQFVPGQSATPGLKVKVVVPYTMTAWEVSPGRVRGCPIRRELGGTEVELKNFSLTAAVVFTSDLGPSGLVVQLQDQQRSMGRLAAQWLHDQAKEQLAKVDKVEAELVKMGRAVPDSEALLKKAREALERCVRHRSGGEHSEAYAQAEVALRALRVLMRAEWDRAVRDLDTPVASPYALSYYTLPKHWELADRLKQMRPGASVLRDGDFEAPAAQAGWYQQQVEPLDPVTTEVRKTREQARGVGQSLMLRVAAKTPASPPQVLERTYVMAHSPEVKLRPGTWVRISVWYNVPREITGSPDAALVFDRAYGEPMAARIGEATKGWKRLQLYRKVPASGVMQVTLALSGLGTVYFDDVKIEPLEATGEVAAR